MVHAQASRPSPIEYAPNVGGARKDTMIYWLARAARELREANDRKQVHVAAELSMDQSSIYRFETGESWPRHTDVVVAAYAADLDIEDPREIWELALRLWNEEGQAPTLPGLLEAQADLRAGRAAVARQRRGLDQQREEDRASRRKRAGGER
jgi:transcriptional regulator with XRE-family HTH domain